MINFWIPRVLNKKCKKFDWFLRFDKTSQLLKDHYLIEIINMDCKHNTILCTCSNENFFRKLDLLNPQWHIERTSVNFFGSGIRPNVEIGNLQLIANSYNPVKDIIFDFDKTSFRAMSVKRNSHNVVESILGYIFSENISEIKI